MPKSYETQDDFSRYMSSKNLLNDEDSWPPDRATRTPRWVNCELEKLVNKSQHSSVELKKVETLIYKHIQQVTFPTELVTLRKGEFATKGSQLAALNPYVDETRILRSSSYQISSEEGVKRLTVPPNRN